MSRVNVDSATAPHSCVPLDHFDRLADWWAGIQRVRAAASSDRATGFDRGFGTRSQIRRSGRCRPPSIFRRSRRPSTACAGPNGRVPEFPRGMVDTMLPRNLSVRPVLGGRSRAIVHRPIWKNPNLEFAGGEQYRSVLRIPIANGCSSCR
jgi:hypothetical protein